MERTGILQPASRSGSAAPSLALDGKSYAGRNPSGSYVGMAEWVVICVSCRRIIKAADAHPIPVRRANRRYGISLFGCPDCR